jgi:multiple sugar transport system ATP-binding protein
VILEEVVKTYGEVVAVDHVALRINDGEFVALVGPSGCGKTTTLNLIAGLIELTAGNIIIGDRLVNDLDPKDRDIAMVFQNYALYPNKTVYANLEFPLKMRGVPKTERDRRVRDTAMLLGIEPLLNRRPRELSGGQQQRVALGRALVRNPKVFLMDEPLSNLDAKLRVQMRAELKRFHQELHATIIYVTHDQLEAMTMADKIALMHGGVLQQYGTPDEIFRHPVNVFVAGFIGSPSMNFLRGTVVNEGGAARVVGDGWSLALSPENARRALASGGEVIAGARHTHIQVLQEPAPDAIPAQVYTTEPTGDLTFVHLRVGKNLVVASVDPARVFAPDDRVWLIFDQHHLHLFDAATEQALINSDGMASTLPVEAASLSKSR